MNVKKIQNFTSILSADLYKREYFKGDSNHLEKELKPSYSKTQSTISYLSSKSFISSRISISKSVQEDDISDIIENKVYEELALDMAIAYKINFIETHDPADEKNSFFHVFVVDPLILEKDFADTIEDIKYIDQIIPSALLLRTLYTKEILKSSGVQAFIYFQENDAFFALYSEGEFVYTKSLKFSLKELHTRFCKLLSKQISFEMFCQILSKDGLATTNNEYQQYLIKLFAETCLHVNDIITYTKRVFEIKKIDHIYLSTDIGNIVGLDEYTQTYLSIQTTEFDFYYGYETKGPCNQLHTLMHLYATMPSTQRYECNFSIFCRPPPFIKRESGKLILLISASLAIALLYPITNWSLAYTATIQKSLLENEYNANHNIKTTREANIKLKEIQKKEADKIKKVQEDEYNNKKNILMKIHQVKVEYPMKAKHLAYLTKDFNRYGVMLKSVRYGEGNETNKTNVSKTFTFFLSSTSEEKITELLEYLTKTKTDTYKFSLEHIDFDEKEKSYLSELKVAIL